MMLLVSICCPNDKVLSSAKSANHCHCGPVEKRGKQSPKSSVIATARRPRNDKSVTKVTERYIDTLAACLIDYLEGAIHAVVQCTVCLSVLNWGSHPFEF